ncbi:hypothetical protein [uncultured Deinococcus sp.]|uniref:hypothetical protein n=1 Tax=uncultured Deinococcus sp. TaxID=158789 RepID=UPI00258E9087|nr:hypothetical protein [uncultured Deinococcus sp.]
MNVMTKSKMLSDHPPRSERLNRWARAHSPTNDPPFRWWHGLLLALGLLLYFAQQQTTGLIADISSYPVGDWQAGIYGRLTALFLAGMALFVVRAMHPLMYVGLVIEGVFLMLRIGEMRVTHEPLTASYTLFLAFSAIVSIRIITRPNEYEIARAVGMAREDKPRDVALAEVQRPQGDA